MTFSTQKEKLIQYPQPTLKRAERALFCSPFRLALFVVMLDQSVPLSAMKENTGVESGYSQTPLTESKAEAELVWLINVGLLRREVDGQGLTDSFRLTPLGRQIIAKWKKQKGSFPATSMIDQIANMLNRWLKWSL